MQRLLFRPGTAGGPATTRKRGDIKRRQFHLFLVQGRITLQYLLGRSALRNSIHAPVRGATCKTRCWSLANVFPPPVGTVRVKTPFDRPDAARQCSDISRGRWLTQPSLENAAKLLSNRSMRTGHGVYFPCCRSPAARGLRRKPSTRCVEAPRDNLCPGRRVIHTALQARIRLHLHCSVTCNFAKVLLEHFRVLAKVMGEANQLACMRQANLPTQPRSNRCDRLQMLFD